MVNYVIRRLILFPVTLFCIVLVNFVIVNLAPGDPVTVTEISQEGGASRNAERSMAFGSSERYLQFRERYGLTLPILINIWPWTTQEEVDRILKTLVSRKQSSSDQSEMPVKEYDAMRVSFGDRSRFIMPKLLSIIENAHEDKGMRRIASRFFARGGTQQATLGSKLTEKQAIQNKKIAIDNNLLRDLVISPSDNPEQTALKVKGMKDWYAANKNFYLFEPSAAEKIEMFFFETI